jgi:hypothetical protein
MEKVCIFCGSSEGSLNVCWSGDSSQGIPSTYEHTKCWLDNQEAKKKLFKQPRTTIVRGITCLACKKELPEMTLREHLDGRSCPCKDK